MNTHQSHQNAYKIRSEFSVSIKEMNKAVVEHNPFILHFVGSGDGSGLIFHNDEKNDEDVMSTEKGKIIFSSLKDMARNLEIVILSACFSEPMAEVINKIGLTTIGICDDVDEKKTTVFSTWFYWRYIETGDIHKAFDFGKVQVISELENEDLNKYDKSFQLFMGKKNQEPISDQKLEEDEQKDSKGYNENSEIAIKGNRISKAYEKKPKILKPEIPHKAIYLKGDISKIEEKNLQNLEKYLTKMGSQYQFGTDNSNYKLLSFKYLEGIINDIVKCNDQLLDLDTSKRKYDDSVLENINLEKNILDNLISVLKVSNNNQSELYDSAIKLSRYLKKTIPAISKIYLSSNIRPNAMVNSRIIIPLSIENAKLVTVLKKMKNSASKYFLN